MFSSPHTLLLMRGCLEYSQCYAFYLFLSISRHKNIYLFEIIPPILIYPLASGPTHWCSEATPADWVIYSHRSQCMTNRLNVNQDLDKGLLWCVHLPGECISETISVIHWTKGRTEQSWVENIRGNYAFLLIFLMLHWIHQFTMTRQNVCLISII